MNVLYTKFTRERDLKFQQKTVIYQDGNQRIVVKYPLSKYGIPHIIQMFENYKKFENRNILCPSKIVDSSIYFEYLEGKSLNSKLLEFVEESKYDEFIKAIIEYKELVDSFGEAAGIFHCTDEFKEVFDEASTSSILASSKYLNIDLTFDNLIFHNGSYKAIDYEWIFNFPIPNKFVLYRAIYTFYVKNTQALRDFINLASLYSLLNIQENDVKVFESMDANFLNYVYGKKLNYDKIKDNYKKDFINVKELYNTSKYYLQVFFDLGKGFCSEDSTYAYFIKNKYSPNTLRVKIPNGCHSIRIDPGENPIEIKIHNLSIVQSNQSNIDIKKVESNAYFENESFFCFDKPDPQIIFDTPTDVIQLDITISVYDFTPLTRHIMEKANNEINTLNKKHEESIHAISIKNEELAIKNEDLCKALFRASKMKNIYLEIIYGLKSSYNK